MNYKIIPFDEAYRVDIIDLWGKVFEYKDAHNSPELSLQHKLDHSPELLLIAVEEEELCGAVMGGYDGHRGWIYSLAVAPEFRGQGVGAALMQAIEDKLTVLGAVKINLQLIGHNRELVRFYESLGYMTEDRISLGKKIVVENN